jgi:hypothetical protein
MTYLNVLLPYFSWLLQFSNYQSKIICWDAEPNRIREAVHNYLIQKLVCKIRNYNGSNKAINLTVESPKTIRIFYQLLKVLCSDEEGKSLKVAKERLQVQSLNTEKYSGNRI